jgi:hypothetical protein
MSAGFGVAATTSQYSSYWGNVVIAMALMAAGLALTTGPATEAIMGALPLAKAGAGSAVNDTTREVGGTLGVAIIGSALNSTYGGHVLTALRGLGAPADVAHQAGQSVVAGVVTAAHFPPALRAAASESVKASFVTGVHTGSYVAAGATFAAALVALAFLPARARDRAATAPRVPDPRGAVAACLSLVAQLAAQVDHAGAGGRARPRNQPVRARSLARAQRPR